MIKAIVNQDRRERQTAGYRQGSNGLARRIAEEFGLKLHTVLAIKERKRRQNVYAARLMQRTTTMPAEKMDAILQRRIRSGKIAGPFKRLSTNIGFGGGTFRKALRKLGKPAQGGPTDG